MNVARAHKTLPATKCLIVLSWWWALLCCMRETRYVAMANESWRISAAAACVKHWWTVNLPHSLTMTYVYTLHIHPSSISAGFAVFTFRLSWVSPGAVEVWVATPLSDGLHFTPERVQAEFVGVLLLKILGGWRVGAVSVLSGCLVLRAGPGLHAHLGGAGISGTDIHTRKEIARMHANQRAGAQRRIQTQEEWRVERRGEGWISRESPERWRDKRSGMEGGPEWGERWRERTQRGVSIVLAKCGLEAKYPVDPLDVTVMMWDLFPSGSHPFIYWYRYMPVTSNNGR